MKKKLLAVLLCGLLTFSLAACGSSDDVAEDSQVSAVEEDEDDYEEDYDDTDEDDAVTDETWDQLQDLYVSLNDAYEATLEFYNDDSVAQSDDIEEALSTASELMEEIGNVSRADVKESEAEDWVEAMLAVNEIFEAVVDNAEEAGSSSDESANASDIAATLTTTYAGFTNDEDTYAYLGFGDEVAALCFWDIETNESGSFVGVYETDDENSAITITDESVGASITFTVEEVAEGYYLDMGDIGVAYVEPVDPEEFAEALEAISEGTNPLY